jgi:hypothetical protein
LTARGWPWASSAAPTKSTWRLYDAADGRPGSVLESIRASGQMPPFMMYGSGHLVNFESATHPPLRAGETYWLLPLASGDTLAAWNLNIRGIDGPDAESFEAEPASWNNRTDRQGAFEADGTPSPVPEPGGLILAAAGAAACLACAARARARRGAA